MKKKRKEKRKFRTLRLGRRKGEGAKRNNKKGKVERGNLRHSEK